MASDDFKDPELPYTEGSEIEAVVDVAIRGTDGVSRPIYINQSQDFLQLTLQDAERLNEFLTKAIIFIKEYNSRTVQ